jgi:hypothetical protein
MKNKKYKACAVCTCVDCRDGANGRKSWMCPVLKEQICDVCCHYDADACDIKFKDVQMRYWCTKVKCRHLV